MTSREKLAAELDSVRRESTIVSICVWIVAVGVMIYGLGNVYGLLVDHNVPAGIAWLLSPMVDAGLCVGLVGTRGLTRYGVPAGWVGALRWITALMTLGLNIATSIVKHDVLGVFIHSVGPILLFVIVEAAAAYQYKIGRVIGDKQTALDEADRKREAENKNRADLTAENGKLRAALTAAQSEITAMGERLIDAGAHRDAERADLTLTVERLEKEIETLTAEHAEALRKIREKHVEKLQQVRAEAGTVSLTAYRGKRTAQPSPMPANRPAMSDEEAVQAMFDEHSDPTFEWAQNAVRKLTGVGFGRIPRLITAWQERALRESGGDTAVNQ